MHFAFVERDLRPSLSALALIPSQCSDEPDGVSHLQQGQRPVDKNGPELDSPWRHGGDMTLKRKKAAEMAGWNIVQYQ